MKFEEWWDSHIKDNPLWKIEYLTWRDMKAIAKIAYVEGMHREFEKNLLKDDK